MKILYVASVPHSGSTILANALGELDGFFSAGELMFLPHVVRAGRMCGCGLAFDRCPVWSQVLDAPPPLPDDRWLLARNLPFIVLGHPPGGGEAHERYRRALRDLYARIAEATGCRVLVDSSKAPSYAHALASIDEVDLYVIHVVRDPRATAFSWRRFGKRLDTSPFYFGLVWSYWNATIPLVARRPGRYRLVRYEEFVARPEETLRSLAAFVGEPVDALPFTEDGRLRLGVNHTAAGNNNRFRIGEVELRLDDASASVPARTRLATTLATWPLERLLDYFTTSVPIARPAAPSPRRPESSSP